MSAVAERGAPPAAERRARRPSIGVRDATPADNAALVALASSCAMAGDVGLCIDRAPDFFALNRLEGERWRVGVATAGGAAADVVGCIAVAEREAYVNGAPTRTCYVSDLKVSARHRGGPAADALSSWARAAAGELVGDHAPITLTILAGNASMERRASGPRGTPELARFATIDAWAVPLLWRRAPEGGDCRVDAADERDVDEMAALWTRIAPERQLAGVMDAPAPALATWIERAPGLALSDYLLARGRDGRIAGFVALWDQSSFKRLRVTSYSRRLAAARLAINAVASMAGAAPLPPAGEPLHASTAVHLCVPSSSPHVLRALLLAAYDRLRGRDQAFFTVGLDARDPLRVALSGLLAQPTAVHAYVTAAAGRYAGPALGGLPLHHEVALV